MLVFMERGLKAADQLTLRWSSCIIWWVHHNHKDAYKWAREAEAERWQHQTDSSSMAGFEQRRVMGKNAVAKATGIGKEMDSP